MLGVLLAATDRPPYCGGVAHRFAGRKVLITGGGGGVGSATAVRLADEGAAVAVLDRRLEDADRTVERVRATGGTASVAEAVAASVQALGGLLMLTRKVAVEYAPKGVRANVVCPGAVRTGIIDNVVEDFPDAPGRDHWAAPLPFQLPDDAPSAPEDVAAAVAFLASDDARKVTGAVLMVDGGWSAI